MANVLDFGARGDGVADDTAALTHALQRGDGQLVLPRGTYRITTPLYVPLQQVGRFSIDGSGGTAKILMAGPGPALHLVGSHGRTAHPGEFREEIWTKERCPILQNLEIEGAHPQADGVRVEGVMQLTLTGLLIRRCRFGVHLTQRDRNVLISACHIYDNSAIGVFMDRVNLHQINIVGSHISYNKEAGIKVVGSEIRNIQISGNDIEYNYDLKREDCADVYFDCRDGTVREGTIVANTIQAVGSPGGANVRLIGAKDYPEAVGLLAITGNLLGSQSTVLDLVRCRAVTVSGNSIYSGYRHALIADGAEHLVISGNTIDHNPQYKGNSTDQLILKHCRNVTMSGSMVQHTLPSTDEVEASVLIEHCEQVNFTGIQIVNARRRGLMMRACKRVRLADSTITGRAGDRDFRASVVASGDCRQVMIRDNFLAKGSEGEAIVPREAGSAEGNQTIED